MLGSQSMGSDKHSVSELCPLTPGLSSLCETMQLKMLQPQFIKHLVESLSCAIKSATTQGKQTMHGKATVMH